jgi:prolyl oligopeptidase
VTELTFYASRDGTRVPIYLVHRRDMRRDGSAPAWVYGYGTLAWQAAPWFQPNVTEWLLRGGVWALPGVRGGAEYGERWRAAGQGANKQRGVDDYLAAAEWLVARRYASAGRVVAHTSSAGGVLVAAAVAQRPELFAAAVFDYPAIDVLRYDAFDGGRRWTHEYGRASDPADFPALYRLSPLHALRPGACYPATIASPGERDVTAAPMHAYKWVAALQHAQGCGRPVLLRVSWGAGHSSGASVGESVDNWADQLALVLANLGTAGRR